MKNKDGDDDGDGGDEGSAGAGAGAGAGAAGVAGGAGGGAAGDGGLHLSSAWWRSVPTKWRNILCADSATARGTTQKRVRKARTQVNRGEWSWTPDNDDVLMSR